MFNHSNIVLFKTTKRCKIILGLHLWWYFVIGMFSLALIWKEIVWLYKKKIQKWSFLKKGCTSTTILWTVYRTIITISVKSRIGYIAHLTNFIDDAFSCYLNWVNGPVSLICLKFASLWCYVRPQWNSVNDLCTNPLDKAPLGTVPIILFQLVLLSSIVYHV